MIGGRLGRFWLKFCHILADSMRFNRLFWTFFKFKHFLPKTTFICVNLWLGGSDGLPFPKALVVSDDVGLWALDLRNGSTKILHSTKNVIHSFDIYKNKTIYWKEAGRSSIESLSKSEKYPIFESSRNWEPKSLKIDYLTKKVYVLDKDTNSLQVFDMNIKQHGIVMTGLDRPRDFAIDTRKRLLFVVQKDSVTMWH